MKYRDIEVGLDFDPEPELADYGDLEMDLPSLLDATGEAAREADSVLVVFIDELQYVADDELAALVTALHRTRLRRRLSLELPVVGEVSITAPGVTRSMA